MSLPLLAPDRCVENAAGGQRQQHDNPRDREAAAAFLIAVLWESLLVGWSIGHAHRRAVHDDDATAVEQPVSDSMRLVAVSGLPNQPRKE